MDELKNGPSIELNPRSWPLRTVTAVVDCQVALFRPRKLPRKQRIQRNAKTVSPSFPRTYTQLHSIHTAFTPLRLLQSVVLSYVLIVQSNIINSRCQTNHGNSM